MLTKGNESPFVRRHAVESLNFQISLLIYGDRGAPVLDLRASVGSRAAGRSSVARSSRWCSSILASIKAANGEDYRYPLTLRLVS